MIETKISLIQMLTNESVTLEYFEDVEFSMQKNIRQNLKKAEDYFIAAEELHYSNPKHAIANYKKASTEFMKIARAYESAGKKKYGALFLGAIAGSSFAQLIGIGINAAIVNRSNKKVIQEEQNLRSGDTEALDRVREIKNKTESDTKTVSRLAPGIGAGIGTGAMNVALKTQIRRTGDYLAKRINMCEEAIAELEDKYSANENLLPEVSLVAQTKLYDDIRGEEYMIKSNVSLEQMIQSNSVYGDPALELFNVISTKTKRDYLRKKLEKANKCLEDAKKLDDSDKDTKIEKLQIALQAYLKLSKDYASGNLSLLGIEIGMTLGAILGFIGTKAFTDKQLNKKYRGIAEHKVNETEDRLDHYRKTGLRPDMQREYLIMKWDLEKLKKQRDSHKATIAAHGGIAGMTAGAVGGSAILVAGYNKDCAYLGSKISECKKLLNDLGAKTPELDREVRKIMEKMPKKVQASHKTTTEGLSPLAQKIYRKAYEEALEVFDPSLVYKTEDQF